VTPADAIALARALASIPIAWLIVAGDRPVALALFLIAAASDAMDGWLARRTGLTARGAFLDPLADKILVVVTLAALAMSGAGWPVTLVTIAVAAREVVVTALRVGADVPDIPADRWGKLKTTAQMVGVALVILGGRPWSVLGTGIVGLAFLLSVATLPRFFAARRTVG
jgi:CDP-diacylglycerol--glycerol-3-phosphate 3-phosphatidyltransferase